MVGGECPILGGRELARDGGATCDWEQSVYPVKLRLQLHVCQVSAIGKKTNQIDSRWRIQLFQQPALLCRYLGSLTGPMRSCPLYLLPHFLHRLYLKPLQKNHPGVVVHTCTCLLPPLEELRRVARSSRLAWAMK